MPWLAAAIPAVVGTGLSIYGSSQQSKANKAAQEQNAALQREQNDAQWANWLMTRGLAPTQPTPAGVLPSAGQAQGVNTRLPLWANVAYSPTGVTGDGVRLIKKGSAAPSGAPQIGGLVSMGLPGSTASAAPATPASAPDAKKLSGLLLGSGLKGLF